MIVGKGKLAQILYMNCVVNIIADSEVLKYRYMRDTDGNTVWFCNGVNTSMQATELIKHLVEKYNEINVKYKRQF